MDAEPLDADGRAIGVIGGLSGSDHPSLAALEGIVMQDRSLELRSRL